MPTSSNNIPSPANLFRPSEIIGILRNHLATGQVNQRVVCLRGIYFKGSYVNQYFHTATDRLVDESTSDELSLSMPLNLRDDLENGNVITVHGILDRSITNKGLIQIVLKVTEVEKIKELAVSEDEIKRTELKTSVLRLLWSMQKPVLPMMTLRKVSRQHGHILTSRNTGCLLRRQKPFVRH